MKKMIPMIGVGLAGILLLAGCGHKQSNAEDASTAPANSTKLNNLLSPAKVKVPEDSQNSNGDQVYSQFYKKGGQWYWKLTSQQDGTIDNSQIKSMKSTDQNDVYNFSMVSNKNKSYNMKFNWINGGHQAYTVNAAYHNVNSDFILADAKVAGQWQTGAPQAIQGTWATDFTNNSGNDAQKLPFTKQFLNITSSATSSFVNEYDSDHRLYNSETAAKTSNVSYKQNGDSYIVKSYNSDETPVVYSISLISSNQIKVNGLTSSDLTMSKSATSPTTSSSQSTATSQSGSAVGGSTAAATSSHLTDQQVVNWIWPYVKAKYPNMNVASTDFTYMPQMRNGQMYVNVLENHSAAVFKNSGVDSGTNPQVASFRVTSDGALEQMDATTGDWSVVSSGYNG